MTTQIDREGAFRAMILESGVSTSKAGMPQFVAEFKATEKWVDTAEEMTAFGLTEPGWVDWSGYDMSTVGYLQLVYDKKDSGGNPTGEIKPMFYVEALVDALGWDGTSFNALGTTDWTKTPVTIWIEPNEYNGKTTLRVQAIGKGDAAPSRGGVRALETGELNKLDAQFASVLAGAAAPAPATPATVPVAAVAKPATAPAPTPAPAVRTATETAETSVAMTMLDAWSFVAEKSPSKPDAEREAAWLKACATVGIEDQDAATGEQWAAVAKVACSDLDCPF